MPMTNLSYIERQHTCDIEDAIAVIGGARELLTDWGWVRNATAMDDDGRKISFRHPAATRFDMSGALMRSDMLIRTELHGDSGYEMSEGCYIALKSASVAITGETATVGKPSLIDLNDAPDTTLADIHGALENAIDILANIVARRACAAA